MVLKTDESFLITTIGPNPTFLVTIVYKENPTIGCPETSFQAKTIPLRMSLRLIPFRIIHLDFLDLNSKVRDRESELLGLV